MRRAVLLLLCVLLPSVIWAQNSIRAKGTAAVVGVMITQMAFPDGTRDVAYAGVTVTVTGGTGPYTCALFSGALPTSITETSECHYGVGQTPTVAGTYNFCLKATDSLAAVSPQQCYTVIIAVPPGLPAGWFSSDIGPTGTPGTALYSAGTYTLTSSGANITGSQDSFRYAWTTCTDTCVITARITVLTGYAFAQAGAMLRADSTDSAAMGFSFMLPVATGSLNQGKNRTSAGGTATNESSGQDSQEWVQVRRSGANVSMWNSPDGVTYSQVGITHTTTLSSGILAGLACTNIDTGSTATCAFDNVTVDDSEPSGADYGGYRNTYQGYGTHTPGGRGGTLYRVTSLANSGAGTFRAAMEATGPRVIVFDTSGTITLTSYIYVTSPFLTIAGQTAPSPGITIKGMPIVYQTHDVVIQHMRFRMGDLSCTDQVCQEDNQYIQNGAYNIVYDHTSLSWGTHENAGMHAFVGQEVTNITFLDSILSEPLTRNPALVSINALFYGNDTLGTTSYATVLRTLFTQSSDRSPWFGTGWQAAVANNVCYNPAGRDDPPLTDAGQYGCWQMIGYTANNPFKGVYQSNVMIAGLNTLSGMAPIKIDLTAAQVSAGTGVYLGDNSWPLKNSTPAVNQWSYVKFCSVSDGCSVVNGANEANTKITSLPSWYTAFNFNLMANASVLAYVQANAGARPLDRDSVDTRIAATPSNGTGSHINSQTDVGGWPTLAVNTATWADPSTPNGDGDCGITAEGVVRTRRECALNVSAEALEP